MSLVPLVLLYWIFAVKIPSEVSYSEVWASVTALTFGENLALLFAGLLTIVVYGWTSATVLPGLSLRKGTQSAVSGQMTSVVLPPPIDLVIRFSMYKSYGFSVDKSTIAVGVAGIARYFTVFALPLMGLGALILVGQGTEDYGMWLLVGGALFGFALWLMRLVLMSDRSARAVGRVLQNIITWVLNKLHRTLKRDIVAIVADFSSRTRAVAIGNFRPIAISNIAWSLSCYFVMLLSIRFCGIDASIFSAAYVLLITGCMLLLNAFPITPGGIGVTEAILVAFIPFPSEQVQAAFLSALFVYRIYTWLLPLPVGGIAYFTWRHQQKGKKSV